MDTSYLNIPDDGRVHPALKALKGTRLEPGDSILLRDFAQILPRVAWSTQEERGKWRLVPYELADGQAVRLLAVNDVAGDEGAFAVPPDSCRPRRPVSPTGPAQ